MTEEQRDNLLLSMAGSLSNFENVQEKILARTEKLENARKELEKGQQNILEKVGKVEKSQQNILEKVGKVEKSQQNILEKVEKGQQNILEELERQRMNTARLEYNLTDQIRALFDVREINKDKFEEQDKILQTIDRTLDSHNRRLLKLEKAN